MRRRPGRWQSGPDSDTDLVKDRSGGGLVLVEFTSEATGDPLELVLPSARRG